MRLRTAFHIQQTPKGKMDTSTKFIWMNEAPMEEWRGKLLLANVVGRYHQLALKVQHLLWRIPGKTEAQTHMHNIIFF